MCRICIGFDACFRHPNSDKPDALLSLSEMASLECEANVCTAARRMVLDTELDDGGALLQRAFSPGTGYTFLGTGHCDASKGFRLAGYLLFSVYRDRRTSVLVYRIEHLVVAVWAPRWRRP